jgi:hypothetical protein
MRKQLNAVFSNSNGSSILKKLLKAGFVGELDENCTLLGYYATCSGNSLPNFRDNFSVLSSTVKNRFLTPADRTGRLSRNFCKETRLLAASQPRKAQFSTTTTSHIGTVLQKLQKSKLSSAFWGFHWGVIDSPIFWDVTLSVVISKSIMPEGQSVLLGVKPLLGRPPFKACAPKLTYCGVFNAQRKMEL